MTKRKYQFMAAVGFLLGFVGLANLGYIFAGEPLTAGTIILVICGLAGLLEGVVAVIMSHKFSPCDQRRPNKPS